jgi:hypothetical protein
MIFHIETVKYLKLKFEDWAHLPSVFQLERNPEKVQHWWKTGIYLIFWAVFWMCYWFLPHTFYLKYGKYDDDSSTSILKMFMYCVLQWGITLAESNWNKDVFLIVGTIGMSLFFYPSLVLVPMIDRSSFGVCINVRDVTMLFIRATWKTFCDFFLMSLQYNVPIPEFSEFSHNHTAFNRSFSFARSSFYENRKHEQCTSVGSCFYRDWVLYSLDQFLWFTAKTVWFWIIPLLLLFITAFSWFLGFFPRTQQHPAVQKINAIADFVISFCSWDGWGIGAYGIFYVFKFFFFIIYWMIGIVCVILYSFFLLPILSIFGLSLTETRKLTELERQAKKDRTRLNFLFRIFGVSDPRVFMNSKGDYEIDPYEEELARNARPTLTRRRERREDEEEEAEAFSDIQPTSSSWFSWNRPSTVFVPNARSKRPSHPPDSSNSSQTSRKGTISTIVESRQEDERQSQESEETKRLKAENNALKAKNTELEQGHKNLQERVDASQEMIKELRREFQTFSEQSRAKSREEHLQQESAQENQSRTTGRKKTDLKAIPDPDPPERSNPRPGRGQSQPPATRRRR